MNPELTIEDLSTMTETPVTARYSVRVVCAWCRTDLGTKPCAAHMDGAVTHGICVICAPALQREIDDLKRNQFAEISNARSGYVG